MQLWKTFNELTVTRKLRMVFGTTLETLNANGVLSTFGLWKLDAKVVKSAAPTALTTAVTLTAAQILVGHLTFSGSGAATTNYTLPTATAFDTALHASMAADDAFDFVMTGIGTVAAETATILTGAGWTLVGSMIVASNAAGVAGASARFRARKTAANAFTLYRIS